MIHLRYNQSRGVYISALEHCREIKFRKYFVLTLISKYNQYSCTGCACSKKLVKNMRILAEKVKLKCEDK